MRSHVREVHETATYDLDGEPVHRGYGWTDDYVAVLGLMDEADIERAMRDTTELLREQKGASA